MLDGFPEPACLHQSRRHAKSCLEVSLAQEAGYAQRHLLDSDVDDGCISSYNVPISPAVVPAGAGAAFWAPGQFLSGAAGGLQQASTGSRPSRGNGKSVTPEALGEASSHPMPGGTKRPRRLLTAGQAGAQSG